MSTSAAINMSGAGFGPGSELVQPKLKGYTLTVNALGSVSGNPVNVDLTLGNYVTATSGGTTTWAFTNPATTGIANGFILVLTNGGAYTQNWPASVDWPSGTAPTLTAAGIDILVFMTNDGGTTWRGVLNQLDSK